MSETIVALATPYGRSGVAVIRVSGQDAYDSLKILINGDLPEPRYAALKTLYISSGAFPGVVEGSWRGETIDKALVTIFEAGKSFTGEKVVEYACHGSLAVIDQLLFILQSMPNHRLAEPGEFTRRAFENGQMDLTEAEAIEDLINAETILQKRAALDQLEGGLRTQYEAWAKQLKEALAYQEAAIDFSDDGLDDDTEDRVLKQIETLITKLSNAIIQGQKARKVREGLVIALIGAPNAGKSTLFNALIGKNHAITSASAGTTRDALRETVHLGGIPVTFVDTAGLRARDVMDQTAQGAIEEEGVKRAIDLAKTADLRLIVLDTNSDDREALQYKRDQDLVVFNKSDLAKPTQQGIYISAKKGDIAVLQQELDRNVAEIIGEGAEAAKFTRERHIHLLNEALDHLNRAKSAVQTDLRGEDLRLALRALGKITGGVDVEDILDTIFSSFCIGK